MWLITFESQVISVITKAMYAGVEKLLAKRWHSHDDRLNALQLGYSMPDTCVELTIRKLSEKAKRKIEKKGKKKIE